MLQKIDADKTKKCPDPISRGTLKWPVVDKILSFKTGLIQILINDRLEGWKKKQQQQQKS